MCNIMYSIICNIMYNIYILYNMMYNIYNIMYNSNSLLI